MNIKTYLEKRAFLEYPAMVFGGNMIGRHVGKTETEKNRYGGIAGGATVLGGLGADLYSQKKLDDIFAKQVKERQETVGVAVQKKIQDLEQFYNKKYKTEEGVLDKYIKERTEEFERNLRKQPGIGKKLRKTMRDVNRAKLSLERQARLSFIEIEGMKEIAKVENAYNNFEIKKSPAYQKATKSIRIGRKAIPIGLGILGSGLLAKEYFSNRSVNRHVKKHNKRTSIK